ncbi:4Fe-4S dicluster domain-containing protein [Candidatus Bathyarchaeota archaeon]|nr:4Fe-4S dicluster domain-containing protein [Candidatus Bathyarchaeota archaeon]
MPLRTVKKDTAEKLTLEWILHVRNYRLTVDRKLCVGCQICTLACPKEAITLEKQPKDPEEKAQHAQINIDLEKCNFCAICDIICPYGAVKVTVNGEHVLSVLEKESFPQLIRDIQVDPSKYPARKIECEEACPLDLISVTRLTTDGEVVEDMDSLSEEEKDNLQVKINIDEEHCPACRVCEFKCPDGVIQVKKIFHGKLVIHQEKCPDGCTDCLDVCPITDALSLLETDGKVYVNEMFCVYCGACKAVCPVEEAMDLQRGWVRHTPVASGAWNKALEKIASPVEITKELKAKGSQKAKESVEKRLGWRAT